MEETQNKKLPRKWLIGILAVLVVVAAVVVILVASNNGPKDDQPEQDTAPAAEETEEQIMEEDPGIPLDTDYIALTYPSELEEQVKVKYEKLDDGQAVIFTTELTGQELELFRVCVSTSGTEGFQLGKLVDDQAGELIVCTLVQDLDSSLPEADLAALNALQERVNDIIVQFYEDPRFVPNHAN